MKLIGDKSIFALEYEIKDKKTLLGYSRIWFGGHYIGSKKELIYIKNYLLDEFNRISNIQKLYLNIDKMNVSDKYNLLKQNLNNIEDELIHKYLVSFGTLTDDYTILSYLDNDSNFCVIWKLDAKPYFDDIDYSDKEIKFFKMPREKFLKELERFERIILDEAQ